MTAFQRLCGLKNEKSKSIAGESGDAEIAAP